MFKLLIGWGWSPVLITALAIIGYLYQWPMAALIVVLVTVLVIGLVTSVVLARERSFEFHLVRFRQLVGYFSRRFMGDSSMSIFAIIDSLFKVDNPKVWDWARACDMSKRVFNTWGMNFVRRVESDLQARRFDLYMPVYLNELWLMNTHYYEFVEQFYEIARSIEIPKETLGQYNRFVMEYNAFIQDFRESISELGKIARTGIEPPSLQMASQLKEVR